MQCYPSIKLAGSYFYTWVKLKCLAQEDNTLSPAGARTQAARSGDECNKHKAIVSSGVGVGGGTKTKTEINSAINYVEIRATYNSEVPQQY